MWARPCRLPIRCCCSDVRSEKLDVVRLTFYTAPVSLLCLAPFYWVYEVGAAASALWNRSQLLLRVGWPACTSLACLPACSAKSLQPTCRRIFKALATSYC
jgi:hypothetical protein